jgi:predicted peptidase
MIADPNNTNYVAEHEEEMGGEQCLTAVYVPYDEEKQAKTIEREEEAPRDGENGTVFFEEVTTDAGIDTSYGVYLPYEFDADREEAYPILVLFHGGGGYDGSWFTNGLVNILDNMIAEGRLEPTIVVTPNGSDFPSDNGYMWDRESILDFVVNSILPNMTENYNASDDPARRAFAGLSMGGATTAYAMFNDTDDFDTYILFSAPFTGDIDPDYENEELKDKTIFFGYGDYDFVVTRSLYKQAADEDGNLVPVMENRGEGSIWEYMYGLNDAGVEFTTLNYPYGHDWVLWRKLIVNVFDEILWK